MMAELVPLDTEVSITGLANGDWREAAAALSAAMKSLATGTGKSEAVSGGVGRCAGLCG